jgi:peptidoglycan glycosyltransferase
MNAPLRRVGFVLVLLFGLLFVNLNYVQAYRADEYRNSDYNGRVQIDEYRRQRGSILVGRDLQAAARSVETDGQLKYLREYPFDGTYAHILGFNPVNGRPTGIERLENDFLAGTSDKLFVDRIRYLFTGGSAPGGNVLTTLSRAGQETALEQLRDNATGTGTGAVVALDPRTGAVQVLVSLPTYNPNPLAAHDTEAAGAAYQELEDDPDRPLLNRAISERYPPGSTFKVIDSAALLDGGASPDTVLEAGVTYTPPDTTNPIANAPGVVCGDQLTLRQALTVSCNTAFSRAAVEELGTQALREAAAAFGFEEVPTFTEDEDNDLVVAPSVTGEILDPDGSDDLPALAQSAIGQASVAMTPLQGALIAATVANGGRQMRPYLVQQLQAPDLSSAYTASPDELRRPVSGEIAAQLRDMMVSVVQNGTGTNAQIADYVVGGKTGTAEHGEGEPDHGWFIGFVLRGDEPISAVAVLLESAGDGGSPEAARIAGEVMRAIIGEQGGD